MKGELHIEEHPEECSPDGIHLTDQGGGSPRPLGSWRDYLAEHDGRVPGFHGETVPVDLSRWAGRPSDVLLHIYVRWVDPALVGTTDPDPPARVRSARPE